MNKLLITIVCMLTFCFSFFSLSYAQSTYVLPYPSVMPGGIQYKIHTVWENLLKYWYFGSFGQFTYNLKESDKFLVEAKVLFEYKQYLLGTTALEKSNFYFVHVKPYLMKAEKEGKDISQKKVILHEASLKHIEVLTSLKTNVPDSFLWQPEKSPTTQLPLKKVIQDAIEEREIGL